jgi:uracil-DNA glycosylase
MSRPRQTPAKTRLAGLAAEIRACRVCRDSPAGKGLPHEPRPILRVSTTARIGVFGQAPGTRVHASGIPFSDPSGVRLRQWMGVTEDEFYDVGRVAVVPMGFCFPGLDAKGGDLPPRKECAPLWRARLMQELPNLEIILLIGTYAQSWHLGPQVKGGLTETVAAWREITAVPSVPKLWPLPHPSWRNNKWLKDNPWFDTELLPRLQADVRQVLSGKGPAAD